MVVGARLNGFPLGRRLPFGLRPFPLGLPLPFPLGLPLPLGLPFPFGVPLPLKPLLPFPLEYGGGEVKELTCPSCKKPHARWVLGVAVLTLRLLLGLPPLPFPEGDCVVLVVNPLFRSRVLKYRVIRWCSFG